MTKDRKLTGRIEELEKRVKELEARPAYILHYFAPYYPPFPLTTYPHHFRPVYHWPSSLFPLTTSGGVYSMGGYAQAALADET